MLVNTLARKSLLQTRIIMRFGGGHHHAPYDWRDDHAKNPDLFYDPRMYGVKPASEFTFPHQAKGLQFMLSHPAHYDPKNLNTIYTGSIPRRPIDNYTELPQVDYIGDVAHEIDYESEDLDFQPEPFAFQHFRKQGPYWMWWIIGFMPILFFGNELFFQYWPDAENWRYQRPPPLDYPNPSDTPDTEVHKVFQSEAFKNLHDSGVTLAPYFDIIDGKKVYSKWAGVNEPRQVI